MPSFDTREPISATVDVVTGDVRITAGDVATTVVEVRPSDASNHEDVRAAEQTRVEYADGQLLVKAPKWRQWSPRSHGGSIDVTIELPAGSQLNGSRRDGRLRRRPAASATSGSRPAWAGSTLETAAKLNVKTGVGDIDVDHVTGHAEISTGTGDVRVRALDGSAVIKNSNGADVGRRGRRRPARQGRQRQHRRRRRAGERRGEVVQRRRPRRRGRARLGRARDPRRRRRGRHPRGHRRVPGRQRHAPGAWTTRSSAADAPGRHRREGRGARAHDASATWRSGGRHDPARLRDRRARPAQVLRRQPGPRRRRSRRRRGHRLRAARPERRRQDDDRADPLHADRRSTPAPCGSPGAIRSPTRTAFAPRSASPASSPPSTTC